MSAKLEKSQDEMGRVFYAPSMPGNKTGQQLPYFFDEVLALRVEKDADGNPQWDRVLTPTDESLPVDPSSDCPPGYTEDQRGVPGVARGIGWLRETRSSRWSERAYQELLARTPIDLPDPLRRSWRFYSALPNLGIDLYPEQIDFFQAVTDDDDRTALRLELPHQIEHLANGRHTQGRRDRGEKSRLVGGRHGNPLTLSPYYDTVTAGRANQVGVVPWCDHHVVAP